jgi:ABC-type uncharacterized transport system fused permease/ATPase subunit
MQAHQRLCNGLCTAAAVRDLFLQVLPALLVAPIYFAGKMGLGQVSQVFSAFSRVLYSTSIIIDNLGKTDS